MNRRVVFTLLGTELRMLARDRRTIVLSVLLPLLVMPVMLYGSRFAEQRRKRTLEQTTYRYAVRGPDEALVRSWIARGLAASPEPGQPPPPRFEEVPGGDEARLARDLHAIVEAGPPTPPSPRPSPPPEGASARGPTVSSAEAAVPGAPEVRLLFRGDRDTSREGARRLEGVLRQARRDERERRLREQGFPVPSTAVGRAEKRDLASAGQVAGLSLGRLLTMLLVAFVLTGGSVVATDTLAGEKERGTLETLLTTAASRREIMAAKLLAILVVALTVTLIQVLNLLVYVGFKLIPASAGFAAAVPPPVALLLLVLYLPVAALASAVLLLVSGRARTYKEAQLVFSFVVLAGIVPTLAPSLPGISLRSAIVLVPVSNIAVGVKEVLTGTFDWPFLALAWLVTAAAAAAAGVMAERTLAAERLLGAHAHDEALRLGGLALFERRVLTHFAVMWAALLVVSAYYGPKTDLRLQLAVNLLGLFLGGSLLMIRAYRLPVRETLALRRPPPAAWLALLPGVPGGLIAAVAVFRLASLVLPAPESVLRAFEESFTPEGVPLWQLLPLMTVLPGIAEEIAFRGVLLHGLHRRLGPVALVLVVGAVFGLFHVTLFRLVPTAFLGVVLAAVTVLTGSIFPAMAWHALHNASAVLAGRLGYSLTALPAEVNAAGAVLLAVAFGLLWRHRRPYPGLRLPRPDTV